MTIVLPGNLIYLGISKLYLWKIGLAKNCMENHQTYLYIDYYYQKIISISNSWYKCEPHTFNIPHVYYVKNREYIYHIRKNFFTNTAYFNLPLIFTIHTHDTNMMFAFSRGNGWRGVNRCKSFWRWIRLVRYFPSNYCVKDQNNWSPLISRQGKQ